MLRHVFQRTLLGKTVFPSCYATYSTDRTPGDRGDALPSEKSVPYESSLKGAPREKVPAQAEADVVVIGGGSVGCSTAYHLAKMGAGKVVLVEKDSLTAGTTWHTAGLLWRLSTHELEMMMIQQTYELMTEVLPLESDSDTGWVRTGGLFVSYDKRRTDSFKRMATLGRLLGIPAHMLTPAEIPDVHPLVDASLFTDAMYSPLDGTMDPTGTCTSYTKAATHYGAQIIEGCSVLGLQTQEDGMGLRRVAGVETNRGTIKTSQVINCAGVWAPYIGQMVCLPTPQVTYKHAYVVTQPIEGVKDTPNVRDHDGSLYLKRQGDTLQVGGYESNPILCKEVEKDFAFGLYDLDMDAFGSHLEVACKVMPALATCGMRSTVCGPESFTPDGSPLLGESPQLRGFFYGSGFNSGGMMWGGGAGRQLALWAIKGKPEMDMFRWDIRRFPSALVENKTWLRHRSHEVYAKRYCVAYHNDQPLAGRNLRRDSLHKILLNRGSFFEQRHGWERPGYFVPELQPETLQLREYDFYGAYGNERTRDYPYRDRLDQEYTFEYPPVSHELIRDESLACRRSCVLFNTSYMGRLVLAGPDAARAARLLFASDVTTDVRATACKYTLMLNSEGGIESDLVVARMPGKQGDEYHMIVGGATTEYCKAHVNDVLRRTELKCQVEDRTDQSSILSLQGPKSRKVLRKLIANVDSLKYGHWMSTEIAGVKATLMRVSFVGELGFEVHCTNQEAPRVYEALMTEAVKHGARDAGYRAMECLSIEAGLHHWGHTLRIDDTPLEARLLHLCDVTAEGVASYVGAEAMAKMRKGRPRKILAHFTVEKPVQLFGEEAIWRDGEAVGHTRNAAHGFALDKEVAMGYIDTSHMEEGQTVDQYILSGSYQIERMCAKHAATAFVSSPFDPQRKRVRGIYK